MRRILAPSTSDRLNGGIVVLMSRVLVRGGRARISQRASTRIFKALATRPRSLVDSWHVSPNRSISKCCPIQTEARRHVIWTEGKNDRLSLDIWPAPCCACLQLQIRREGAQACPPCLVTDCTQMICVTHPAARKVRTYPST